MKTVIMFLLLLTILYAQEQGGSTGQPEENPNSRPLGVFIASGATAMLSIFFVSHGYYSLNHFHGAGADIGSGMEILFSIPMACASVVLGGIGIYKYRRWKAWERSHSFDLDFRYDVAMRSPVVLLSCGIPWRFVNRIE